MSIFNPSFDCLPRGVLSFVYMFFFIVRCPVVFVVLWCVLIFCFFLFPNCGFSLTDSLLATVTATAAAVAVYSFVAASAIFRSRVWRPYGVPLVFWVFID